MGKVEWRFVVLTVVISLFFIAASYSSQLIPEDTPTIEFSSNAPFFEEGWSCQSPDGTFTPVTFPIVTKLPPDKHLTLQRVMPADLAEHTSLYLLSSFQHAVVLLDDTVIFEYDPVKLREKLKIAAPGSIYLELEEAAGKTITVRYSYPNTAFNCAVFRIMLGSGTQLMYWQFKSYIPHIVCDLLCFFVGTYFIYFAFCVKGKENLERSSIALGFFAILSAIYLRFGSVGIPLIYVNSIFRYIIVYCVILLFPLPILLLYRERAEERKLALFYDLLGGLCLLNAIVVLSLFLFSGQRFRSNILGSQLLLLVTLATVLCHHVFYLLKGKLSNTRRETIGILALLIFLCFDVATYIIQGTSSAIFLRIGLIIYLFGQLQGIMDNYNLYEKQCVENEKKLMAMQTELLFSQIQPHFLYNALASISYLCEADPPLAKSTVDEFSSFLRGLLNSIGTQRLVPFMQEIAYLRNYVNVEKVRFYDTLRVEYSIEADTFKIPPLTLQPLVENAIRYGVTKRQQGGTVTIRSRELAHSFMIMITDDGVGFNVHEAKADGRSHVGIDNVRQRLQDMCRGSLKIQSTPNIGTVVTILIPKKEVADDDNSS